MGILTTAIASLFIGSAQAQSLEDTPRYVYGWEVLENTDRYLPSDFPQTCVDLLHDVRPSDNINRRSQHRYGLEQRVDRLSRFTFEQRVFFDGHREDFADDVRVVCTQDASGNISFTHEEPAPRHVTSDYRGEQSQFAAYMTFDPSGKLLTKEILGHQFGGYHPGTDHQVEYLVDMIKKLRTGDFASGCREETFVTGTVTGSEELETTGQGTLAYTFDDCDGQKDMTYREMHTFVEATQEGDKYSFEVTRYRGGYPSRKVEGTYIRNPNGNIVRIERTVTAFNPQYLRLQQDAVQSVARDRLTIDWHNAQLPAQYIQEVFDDAGVCSSRTVIGFRYEEPVGNPTHFMYGVKKGCGADATQQINPKKQQVAHRRDLGAGSPPLVTYHPLLSPAIDADRELLGIAEPMRTQFVRPRDKGETQ